MGQKVLLYIYDLSQGMARTLSQQLTGQLIEAIWHTSVVVFGTEYYFGQGICTASPGNSIHGQPLQICSMGDSEIPKDVFEEYIQSLRFEWTADKYHLLDNNCNSFSNELCNFLVGKDIPSHITGLPTQFINSPFGQAIKPIIENLFGPSRIASASNSPQTSIENMTQNQSNYASVQVVNSSQQLSQLLSNNKAVVLYFTSATCPPCRIIGPEYEHVVTSMEKSKLTALKIDVGVSRDIAMQYNITGVPAFKLYKNGAIYDEFVGADRARLKNSIENLVYDAYPPHHHFNVPTPLLDAYRMDLILFTSSANLDAIFSKASVYLESKKISASTLADVKAFVTGTSNSLPDRWLEPFRPLAEAVDKDAFPLLDILRLLAVNPKVKTTLRQKDLVPKILSNVASAKEASKGCTLMALRLACNCIETCDLLTLDKMIENVPYRSITTSLLVESLLSSFDNVRQCGASLSFNMAVSKEKMKQVSEDWVCEVVAGVGKALESDCDIETTLRLLVSLGKMLKFCTQDAQDMAVALELDTHLGKIKIRDGDAKDEAEKVTKAKRLAQENIALLSFQ